MERQRGGVPADEWCDKPGKPSFEWQAMQNTFAADSCSIKL
jgi:hypothetical protein